MQQYISNICEEFAENIENVHSKEWLLPAFKSHVFAALLRKSYHPHKVDKGETDRMVNRWFYKISFPQRLITKAQQVALYEVYKRQVSYEKPSYLAFRRTAYTWFGDCLMVKWCGLTVGIETDGYTHT